MEKNNEINEIVRVLSDKIGRNIEEYIDFYVGEFVERPNTYGCFKRHLKWYIYSNDERNFCTFTGPFSLNGIIYACAKMLHIAKDFKEYHFTEKEQEIYLNNNFHSFNEIDASIHSDAYNEFIKSVNLDGYKQGYNDKLFELILPQERDEVEQIVEERFTNGDYEMAVFMSGLSKIDGISRLKDAANELKKTSYAYCKIMYVLHNATHNEFYLDELVQILKSGNEDERMSAIMSLLRCGKSNKLYEIYKEQCIADEDEDIRSRCVVGMMYCKGIINNPFVMQSLEQPWKRLKLEMYDGDRSREERIKAILEFEGMV